MLGFILLTFFNCKAIVANTANIAINAGDKVIFDNGKVGLFKTETCSEDKPFASASS